MTSKVVYKGDLRTECEHLQSKSIFITDAPLDNQGKGEAFSPTDTVATALASCMLTIMGIKARDQALDITGTYAEVTKFMEVNPRRISGIKVAFTVKGILTDKEKIILENAAKTCPVIYSIHPDIMKDISFNY
ncbi:OsmC family protein [Gillisia limnaea]|uniref:OsmC family protein n=1 Tax=Gillisia limnaea (strain DSM 15749 / LMG 21470 / R-8282) TaxID=865937 RepID=H2BUE4_GILLR|nr:OsmC family protein [Gillisia limnaea]EHQ03822.1 OsmC family protein [Gillisia limnaea DSM 15749]